MIDFEKIFSIHRIQTSNSGRHYRHGWSNVPCPYCHGNDGSHMGFNHAQNSCVCFR